MARLAHVVIPGIPHHVTQRGIGRARAFFEDGDFALYLDLLAEAAQRARSEVWSYCLMPNHVHIVLTPSDATGCGVPPASCTGAIPAMSTRAAAPPGICGRAVTARWR